jgi:hypothetical protein
MVLVGADATMVEARLRAGEIECPGNCEGKLGPWGWARERQVRDHGRLEPLRPRRSRCRACLITHVLLPTLVLLRRMDVVEVIGAALTARLAEGRSRSETAREAGVCWDTARGWVRRFRARATEIRAEFTALAHRWDPELASIEPCGAAEKDALEAIGAAAAAAVRRFGPVPPWALASGASGGRLLSNTSVPIPTAG